MPRGGRIGMLPKLRTITFVDRLTFEFRGNIGQGAVCLSDVDNDGEIELAVGNSSGELAVFKGPGPKPWRVGAYRLGHITTICSGDLFNMGFNVLVVISADGYLHLFDHVAMQGTKPNPPASSSPPQGSDACGDESSSSLNFPDSPTSGGTLSSPSTSTSSTGASSPQPRENSPQAQSSTPEKPTEGESEKRGANLITPIFRQRLPANIKSAMIVDTNGDGFKELVVTLTDRVVRTYQWHHTGDLLSIDVHGHLMPKNKWEFANQVGSTSIHTDDKGRQVLLISQPGGVFLQVRVPTRRTGLPGYDEVSSNTKDPPLKVVRNFEDLVVSNVRNTNVSTEILGQFVTKEAAKSIEDGPEPVNPPPTSEPVNPPTEDGLELVNPPPFAIVTQDGDIIFAHKENVIWNLNVGQPLFCLNKMDVNEDGRDELIVSSWEGNTYIVTQDGRGIEFVFEDKVISFCCGNYTLEDESVKVFVYVTSNGQIFMYYNIALPENVDMTTLPEDLMLTDDIRITPNLTKFLLYAPLKKTNARKQ